MHDPDEAQAVADVAAQRAESIRRFRVGDVVVLKRHPERFGRMKVEQIDRTTVYGTMLTSYGWTFAFGPDDLEVVE